jgi:hypothetical protein
MPKTPKKPEVLKGKLNIGHDAKKVKFVRQGNQYIVLFNKRSFQSIQEFRLYLIQKGVKIGESIEDILVFKQRK